MRPTIRPQGNGFDIGAYESGSSAVPPDKLTLVLSEDRVSADAQFIAKVDGSAVSNLTTVTARNSKGQTQTFSYTGDWAPGTHDIEIDFTNPAKAKSNLWVDDVKWNGTSYLSAPHEMTSSGAFHVMVVSN
jgi:hypothetical protein